MLLGLLCTISLMRPNTGNFTTTLADNGLQPEGLTVELNIKLSIEVPKVGIT